MTWIMPILEHHKTFLVNLSTIYVKFLVNYLKESFSLKFKLFLFLLFSVIWQRSSVKIIKFKNISLLVVKFSGIRHKFHPKRSHGVINRVCTNYTRKSINRARKKALLPKISWKLIFLFLTNFNKYGRLSIRLDEIR